MKGRTRIPDFDRLFARSRHNHFPVRGKRDRRDDAAVRVRLLAQQLQFACQTSQQASVLAKEGVDFEDSGAPESQTLVVRSADPETIFVPSGEKATDVTELPQVFSATQLMSIAIILRTKEACVFGSMQTWDHERLQSRRALKGRRRARDCGKAREKITVRERQRETRMCSRNASRAPWRKAPQRTRWIPCARAVRCARASHRRTRCSIGLSC